MPSSEQRRLFSLLDVHFARVDLHDAGARLLIRVWKLNLPVKTARSQQCRVENINTVGRRNDLASGQRKAVSDRERTRQKEARA